MSEKVSDEMRRCWSERSDGLENREEKVNVRINERGKKCPLASIRGNGKKRRKSSEGIPKIEASMQEQVELADTLQPQACSPPTSLTYSAQLARRGESRIFHILCFIIRRARVQQMTTQSQLHIDKLKPATFSDHCSTRFYETSFMVTLL